MKLSRLCPILTLLLTLLIPGCGGGSSSNTNGSLAISAPTTVAAGKPLIATATYTPTSGVATGLPINFSANIAQVSGGTASANSSGVANFSLSTSNTISTDQTFLLTASTGGLTKTQLVTLLSNKMVASDMSSATCSSTALTLCTFSPTGTFLTYLGGDTLPLNGYTVTIELSNILGGILSWNGTTAAVKGDLYPGPANVTGASGGSGQVPFTVFTVTATTPPSGTTTYSTFRFKITVNTAIDGSGANIIIWKDYSVAFTGL